MTVLADFAVVISLILLPLTGATESRTFFGPDRPWFLPNHIRTPLGLALVGMLIAGLHYQDYPGPQDADPQAVDFFGQVGTAFARVFGLS